MLHTLQQLFAPAVAQRATLVLNHVLSSEPVAQQRLGRHAGKRVRIEALDWPRLLPALPTLTWLVTPAGLLEWTGEADTAAADLHLTVKADNPAALAFGLMTGERPAVDVSGDAAFAGDADWLIANLRWDVAADLERVLPAPVAQALAKGGSAIAQGLGMAVRGVDAARERWSARGGR